MISIDQYLTSDQIKKALEIYNVCKRDMRPPAKRICDEIIKPSIQTINLKLGQENDPMYLSYAVEHVFNEMKRNNGSPRTAS